MAQRIQINIDSDMEEVALASVSVQALCEHFSLLDTDAYQINLCLVEILNNLVEHGFRYQKGNTIRIFIIYDVGRVTLVIEDEADPMELPSRGKDLSREQDPSNLSERGYGLFLVREIMDEVNYEVCSGFNRLTMKKLLDKAHIPS